MTYSVSLSKEMFSRAPIGTRAIDQYIHNSSGKIKLSIDQLLRDLKSIQTAQFSNNLTAEELTARLARSENHCRRLGHMIDELVDQSVDLTQCETADTIQITNLCNVAADVLDDYVEKAVALNCMLTLECPDPVIGDWNQERVKKLLQLLLSNALKYAAKSWVEVRVSTNGKEASLVITNKNISIQPKVHAEKKLESHKGFWLVKALAESLEGTLKIDANENGSCVSIILPHKRIIQHH